MSIYRPEVLAIDTPRLTAEEVDYLLTNGEKDFRNANLMGLNLTAEHFIRADLTDACLVGTILWDANFRDANLTRADLTGAVLFNACLDGANLTDASLFGANLNCAKLRGADFYRTTLTNASLAFADLTGAKNIYLRPGSRGESRGNVLLCRTVLHDGTLFEGCLTT